MRLTQVLISTLLAFSSLPVFGAETVHVTDPELAVMTEALQELSIPADVVKQAPVACAYSSALALFLDEQRETVVQAGEATFKAIATPRGRAGDMGEQFGRELVMLQRVSIAKGKAEMACEIYMNLSLQKSH